MIYLLSLFRRFGKPVPQLNELFRDYECPPKRRKIAQLPVFAAV
jgi:hypothetical protein